MAKAISKEKPVSKRSAEKEALFISRLRKLLLALVMLMILEGLIRKLVGPGIGNFLFLAKDVVAMVLATMLLFYRFEGSASIFQTAYGAFFFVMLVPFALTLNDDALLGVFGFKQYVLFPVVAFAFWAAFRKASRAEFRRFFQWPVMMIIPLTILALLQLRLGSGNWVNRSLGGEDISGFSAGGHLRVSSTFSFVAQFAMYLNAMVFMLGAFLYVRPGKAKMSVYLAMTVCGCFILSSFATGSRTAVLGDGTILGLAGALLLLKGNGKASASFFGTILVGAVAYFGVKYYWPEAFEAYEARSSGTGANSQDIEIEGRMSNALLGWMDGIGGAPPSNFGYGLGVMSNGSGLISPYAARWRANVGWGETDLANTLFEGGYYLVCVWMAFRLFIVAFVLQRVWALRDPQLVTAGCLAAGFVVVEGTMGALGIQPPLAIWFWLAVGTVLALEQLDRRPEPELSPGETNIDGPKAARQKSGARAGFG